MNVPSSSYGPYAIKPSPYPRKRKALEITKKDSVKRFREKKQFVTDNRDILLAQREIGSHYKTTVKSQYGFTNNLQLYCSLDMSDVQKITYEQEVNEDLSQQIYGFSPDGRFFVIFEKEEKVIRVYRYGGLGEVMAMKDERDLKFTSFCHPHVCIEVGSETEQQNVKECMNNYGFTNDSKYLIAAFQFVYSTNQDVVRNQVAQQWAHQNRVLDRMQRIRQELDQLVEIPGESGPDLTNEQRQSLIHRIAFPAEFHNEDTFQDHDFNEHEDRYRHEMREERIARGLDPDGDEEVGSEEERIEQERQPFFMIDDNDDDCVHEVTLVVVDLEGKNLTCELIVKDVKFDTSRTTFLRDRILTLVHKNDDIVMFELNENGFLGVRQHMSTKKRNYELLTETHLELLETHPGFVLPPKCRDFFDEELLMKRLQQRAYSKAFELHFPDNMTKFFEFYGTDALKFRITQCLQATDEWLVLTFEKKSSGFNGEEPVEGPIVPRDSFFVVMNWESEEILDVSNDFGDIFLKMKYREIVQGLFPRTMVHSNLGHMREIVELMNLMDGSPDKHVYKIIYDALLCGRGAGNCFSNPYLDNKVVKTKSNAFPSPVWNYFNGDHCGIDDNLNITIEFPFEFTSARTGKTLFKAPVPVDLAAKNFTSVQGGASFHPIEPFCVFIFENNFYVCRPKMVKERDEEGGEGEENQEKQGETQAS